MLYIEEARGWYVLAPPDVVCAAAMDIAEADMRRGAACFGESATVKFWLAARFAKVQREEFVALWVTAQNGLIEAETLSTGTLTAANVYAREVVKSALRCNAAAVIFAHNHPSGLPEPSTRDRTLTSRLTDALRLVDIRVLDHVVVSGAVTVSFAERGWL